MPRKTRKPEKPETKPETEKTSVNLPKGLKLEAQIYALKTKQDLQDVIADGLRLVLEKKDG